MLGIGLKRQSFRRQISAGSVYVPPLDSISAKVWASFGLSRHFASVNDSLRVRESGGNTEQDIGTLSSSGFFDIGTFNTFIGANNGFARTTYDQKAGNTNSDLPQTTQANQPQVIASSDINSKPGLRFAATKVGGTFNAASMTAIGTGDFEVWAVARPTSLAGAKCVGSIGGLLYFYTSVSGNGNAGFYTASGGGYKNFGRSVSINSSHLLRYYRISGTVYCDVDGAVSPSSFSAADNLLKSANYFWGESGSEQFTGDMTDFIIISGGLSNAERDALKTHFSSIYNIAVS